MSKTSFLFPFFFQLLLVNLSHSKDFSQKILVKKINTKKGLVLSRVERDIELLQRVIIVIDKNRFCDAFVYKKRKKLILFKSYDCKQLEQLKKGLSVKISYNNLSPRESKKWPKSFKVYSFSESDKVISFLIPRGKSVIKGDKFNLFAPDNNFCNINVVRANKLIAYGSLKECRFIYEVRIGLRLEQKTGLKRSTQKFKKSKKVKNIVSSKESFLLFTLGFPSFSYENEIDQNNINALRNSSASHFKIYSDLFGYYKSFSNKQTAFGGVFSISRDAFSTDSASFEVYQMRLSSSIYHFFGNGGVGTGTYLRGDVGLARYASTAVINTTTGGLQSEPEKFGFGALVGVGYGVDITKSLGFLSGLNFERNIMGDSTISTLGLVISVLY